MTLTQALRALRAAGRIRSPWLPGMLAKPPGSLVIPIRVQDPDHVAPMADEQPVLTDPATVGCLLALLREAERDPGATTRAPHKPGDNWYVHLPIEDAWATDLGAPTEGEAIAAALIALAGAL